MSAPTWDSQIEWLERHPAPDARANATLLAGVRARWEPQVVPRTSMSVLLMTVAGEPYPFARCLYCTASAAICEVGLVTEPDEHVEISRCRLTDGPDLLSRGLARLAGGVPGLAPSTGSGELWSAQADWIEYSLISDGPAMIDIVSGARADWHEVVVPIPDDRALRFVAAKDPPTATRSSVVVTRDGTGWTVAFSSMHMESTPTIVCTHGEVLSRLQPILTRLVS